jgi:hypothetical protein
MGLLLRPVITRELRRREKTARSQECEGGEAAFCVFADRGWGGGGSSGRKARGKTSGGGEGSTGDLVNAISASPKNLNEAAHRPGKYECGTGAPTRLLCQQRPARDCRVRRLPSISGDPLNP